MSSPARVLIVEPHAEGHHGSYLSWMTASLATRGAEVLVLTQPQYLAHPSMQAIANGGGTVSVAAHPAVHIGKIGSQQFTRFLAREIAYWRALRDWYASARGTFRPSLVFIPYLDYCLYAIGLFGSPFDRCPWAGVAMRPSFHYRQMGIAAPRRRLDVVKKALFFRLMRDKYLKRLLTVDEPLFEFVVRRMGAAAKIVVLPQPAEFHRLPLPSDAKRELQLPLDRHVILVYGAISARKGTAELLNALAHPEFPSTVDVLLAGQIEEPLKSIFREPEVGLLVASGRVRLLDRYIDEAEEGLLFAACDIVWLGYKGHYTASGVLTQAEAAGRPVIACEEGVIGWETKRYSLGEVVSPGDTRAVVAAVKTLIDRRRGVAERVRTPNARPASTVSRAQEVLVNALCCDGD